MKQFATLVGPEDDDDDDDDNNNDEEQCSHGAAQLLRYLRQITTLICRTLKPSLRVFAEALHGHPSLEHIQFTHTVAQQLPDPRLFAAILSLPKLRDFELVDDSSPAAGSNHILPPGFLYDLVLHKPLLRTLKLERCNLSTEAVGLCHALGQLSSLSSTTTATATTMTPRRGLERLELHCCQLPPCFSGALSHALQKNTSLQHFRLTPVDVMALGPSGRLLGSVLGAHPTLASVNLNLSQFVQQAEELHSLSELLLGLASSATITELVLDYFSVPAVTRIMQALRPDSVLQSLSLKFTCTHAETWQALLQAIQGNLNLGHLTIQFRPFQDDGNNNNDPAMVQSVSAD